MGLAIALFQVWNYNRKRVAPLLRALLPELGELDNLVTAAIKDDVTVFFR